MPHGVHRIAHLSDVHLLDTRPGRATTEQLSMHYLSLGRRLDVAGRIRRLLDGLTAAKQWRADHFVLSGDLTEIGAPGQFETLAETLAAANIAPERITLVPGNHDLYTHADAWRRALEGPLKPFAAGAASEAGKVVERGEVVYLPVDVACYQPITRSAGELTGEAATLLEKRLSDPGLADKVVVLVQHHPPFPHARSAWHWLDGLRGYERILALLAQWPNLRVLHGHLHKHVDWPACERRVFGAPATVDGRAGHPRLRIYDVAQGVMSPVATPFSPLPMNRAVALAGA